MTTPAPSPSLPGHEAPPDATTTTDLSDPEAMARALLTDVGYPIRKVCMFPDTLRGLLAKLDEARASRPSSARCNGHCHCHAGPDGLMHPPCCADCSPSRPSSDPGEEGLRARVEALEEMTRADGPMADRAVNDCLRTALAARADAGKEGP